jgi:UDP-N-acetylmuramoyl-L-alanyl-D-glutamate--2,6-diaminopimelate ligase
MQLGDLITDCPSDAAGQVVRSCVIDHRKVAGGAIFGAFVGAAFNGEDFIASAIAAGAIAIVARPEAQVSGAVHIASDDNWHQWQNIDSRIDAANLACVRPPGGIHWYIGGDDRG